MTMTTSTKKKQTNKEEEEEERRKKKTESTIRFFEERDVIYNWLYWLCILYGFCLPAVNYFNI